MAKILKNQELTEHLKLEELIQLEDQSASNVSETNQRSKMVIGKNEFAANMGAQKILEEAQIEAQRIRDEAKNILAQVEAQCEEKREQARHEAYQQGLEEVTKFVLEAKKWRAKLFSNNENEILRLVFDIARKVIGYELNQNNQAILSIYHQAIEAAVGQKVVLRVHPDDFEQIKNEQQDFLSNVEKDRRVLIKVDESIGLGGCVVESDIGILDAQLDTQLNAIRQALGV